MAFLTKEELKTVATVQLIDKLTAADDSIVNDIIDESISLIGGYLSKYYDVQNLFAAEGADRHLTVLKKLKDIAIYEIYERHTRETNAVAQRRYNEAMMWLEKLNTGEFSDATLPAILVDTDTASTKSTDMRFGGNTRFTSIY